MGLRDRFFRGRNSTETVACRWEIRYEGESECSCSYRALLFIVLDSVFGREARHIHKKGLICGCEMITFTGNLSRQKPFVRRPARRAMHPFI
jgi:hypothetical protein